MKHTTTKIGITAFAFALLLGGFAADASAFGKERGAQKGERHERGCHKEVSEEAQTFRAEQRSSLEAFLNLDEGELKELHTSGEKMSETLDRRGIDEDEMKDFLEEQVQDLVEFIIDERGLDDTRSQKGEERMMSKIERTLERWYN